MIFLKPTDYIAIYAAVVATGVAILQLRLWWEGKARLLIRPKARMQQVETSGDLGPEVILVEVVNRGGALTTLTHLGFATYRNWWYWLRDKQDQSYFVPHTGAQTLPHQLEAGGTWVGCAERNEEIVKHLRSGRLWVLIYASHRDKPYYARLREPAD